MEAGASPPPFAWPCENVDRSAPLRPPRLENMRTQRGSAQAEIGLAQNRPNVPLTRCPRRDLAAQTVIVGPPARIIRNWLAAHGPVLAMNQVGQQITSRAR